MSVPEYQYGADVFEAVYTKMKQPKVSEIDVSMEQKFCMQDRFFVHINI